jgi:signal transduction histidine kinase
VEDEGRGIPREAHDRIFDRFYQVDSSATRAVGGTGLGLYICKKTADALGGRLWLERSGPEGTVFSFWMPERPSGAGGAKGAEGATEDPGRLTVVAG